MASGSPPGPPGSRPPGRYLGAEAVRRCLSLDSFDTVSNGSIPDLDSFDTVSNRSTRYRLDYVQSLPWEWVLAKASKSASLFYFEVVRGGYSGVPVWGGHFSKSKP